jgi:hypothetical protein
MLGTLFGFRAFLRRLRHAVSKGWGLRKARRAAIEQRRQTILEIVVLEVRASVGGDVSLTGAIVAAAGGGAALLLQPVLVGLFDSSGPAILQPTSGSPAPAGVTVADLPPDEAGPGFERTLEGTDLGSHLRNPASLRRSVVSVVRLVVRLCFASVGSGRTLRTG